MQRCSVFFTLSPRVGGCEAGLVLVDGWHQLAVEDVASRLQETLRAAAKHQYRSGAQSNSQSIG